MHHEDVSQNSLNNDKVSITKLLWCIPFFINISIGFLEASNTKTSLVQSKPCLLGHQTVKWFQKTWLIACCHVSPSNTCSPHGSLRYGQGGQATTVSNWRLLSKKKTLPNLRTVMSPLVPRIIGRFLPNSTIAIIAKVYRY